MTRTLSSALLALSLGFGAAAFAQSSQLVVDAQNTLDRYGYSEIDASTLSEAQLAELHTTFGATQEFADDVAARQRIDQILALGTDPADVESQQLLIQAQRTLDQYGYAGLDAEMLSPLQIAELQTSFGDGTEFSTESEAQRRIDQILMMDAATATFVSEQMQALFADPAYPELRQNARDLLSDAGYDPALAEALDVSQLSEMWFLQEDAAERPAGLQNRIRVILDDS